MKPFNNTVFDSRDLIEYKEDLMQQVLDNYIEWVEDHNINCDEGQELEIPTDYDEIEHLDEEAFTMTCSDVISELEDVIEFCDELENYCPDFNYGIPIIHSSYFEDYARELCEEVEPSLRDLPYYIESNINWRGVADDISVDYTEVNFQGSYYFAR
jgi:hypothetical protein